MRTQHLGWLMLSALALGLQAGACGHGNTATTATHTQPASAVAPATNNTAGAAPPAAAATTLPPRTLEEAQAAIKNACDDVGLLRSGAPSSETCCYALMAKGDTLLASGQRQAAYDQYEVGRSRCVRFQPVRRRIFELLNPQRVAASDQPFTEVDLKIDVDPDLREDVQLVGISYFVDGLSWPRADGSKRLGPGAHEINVELYLQSKNLRSGGSPIRLDARNTLVLPRPLAGGQQVAGGVFVELSDAGGQGELSDRLTQKSELSHFKVPTPQAPAPPRDGPVLLAPGVSAGQRLSDVNDPRHKPHLPPELNKAGMSFWGLYKVCVSTEGVVTRVETLRSALTPLLDAQWKTKIRTWRYQPYAVNGKPVPFCSPLRVQVTSKP